MLVITRKITLTCRATRMGMLTFIAFGWCMCRLLCSTQVGTSYHIASCPVVTQPKSKSRSNTTRCPPARAP
ncbi:hypothetical protein EDD17DRAFT_1551773 [Pisolithus thermaeus]|nr:hypothetical protein EDD17DRAFT_1551773 [Pisolithus thermaeus]